VDWGDLSTQKLIELFVNRSISADPFDLTDLTHCRKNATDRELLTSASSSSQV
jgi:hypothetical protein